MAHRINVAILARNTLVLLACSALTLAACSSDAPPVPRESRGQVIDQDTLKPIAGAIVVANYMGGGAFHGSSCNRVESAVSDENGWFSVPVDSRDSPPFFEAYHPQYEHGLRLRWAQDYMEGNKIYWRVVIARPISPEDPPPAEIPGGADLPRATSKIIRYEPTIYTNKREAKDASGENRDVYMKNSKGIKEARLSELRRLVSATSCAAPPTSTSGLVPFLEAILSEEVKLEVPSGHRESTNWFLEQAKIANGRRTK